MKKIFLIIVGVLVAAGAAIAGASYVYWDQAVPLAGMAINYVRSWTAPSGTTTTELAAASGDGAALASLSPKGRRRDRFYVDPLADGSRDRKSRDPGPRECLRGRMT